MSTEPWTVEHHIGPPSEKIIVDGLIKKSGTVTRARSSVESSFSALGVEEQDVLLAECSLSGLKSELNDSLGDPAFRLLYEGYHHSSILDTIDSSSSLDKDCKDWRKKALKERKRLFDQPGRRDDPRLQKLENISLKCWGLQGIRRDAALFVQRPSPHSNNTLLSIKPSPLPAVESGQQDDAIIFVSVYRSNLNRGTPLNIGSKHVFLASNTLEDLHRVIMCPTKDLPYEVMDTNGDVVAYDVDSKVESGLCVAGFDSPIDGVSGAPPFGGGCVVGDGQTPSDYAEHYVAQMAEEPGFENVHRFAASVSQSSFQSLPLRLNHPYLLIHQGNCQHPFTVDEIRLWEASDPDKATFPLTTFTSGWYYPKCKLCLKLPAAFSVLRDIDLGESPCMVCSPCWKSMQGSQGGDNHPLVVPLQGAEG